MSTFIESSKLIRLPLVENYKVFLLKMSSLPSNLSGRSAVKTSLTYHTRQQIRHKAYPKIKGAPGKHVGKPWKGISGEQNLHKIIKMERNPGKHFMDLKNDQMYQPEGLQGSKLVQSLSRMVLFG